MSEQAGFFTRIGSWFKGGNKSVAEGDLPLQQQHGDENGENGIAENHSSLVHPVETTRSTFLRPWAKRDASITQLQEGFTALTGLMGAVKDSLDKQNQRQDEMVRLLGNLPEVMRTIPETRRKSESQREEIRKTPLRGPSCPSRVRGNLPFANQKERMGWVSGSAAL